MTLTRDRIDITGNSPRASQYLIGRSYLHTRTGVRYVAVGFVWMGDLDMWGILHHKVDAVDGDPVFVRSIANFRGNHLDGVPRFSEAVKDFT